MHSSCAHKLPSVSSSAKLAGGALLSLLFAVISPLRAQTAIYWDVNGATTGSGNAGGTWDQSTTSDWTTTAAGTVATNKWSNFATTANSVAHFSAGTDGTGTFTVTTSGTITNVGGITFEEGNVTIGGNGTLTLSQNATVTNTVSGTISANIDDGASSFSLTKAGAQVLTLSGNNTYDGGTTLSAGTLNLNSATAIGTGTLTINAGTINNTSGSAIALSNNNAQTWGGSFTFTGTNDLDLGTGAVSMTGNRTVTVNGGNLTVGGVISQSGGTRSLTKAGTGTLILSGSNTYAGATNINAGTLVAASNNALGTTAGSTTVSSGATLAFQGVTYSTTEAVSVTGTGAAGSNGAIDNTSGTSSFAGAITLAGNTTMGAASGSQLTLSGVITDNASTFGLTKAGAGTLVLSSGANTYTGATTINAGTLSMSSLGSGGAASNLGNSSNVATNLVLNGGTLQYTGAGESTTRLFSIGTSGGTIDASGSAAVNFTNAGSMGFNAQTGTRTLTLTGTNTNANTLAAIIGDNTGATSVAKTGAGEWVLSGANTYTGTTNITGGTLQITNSNALGSLPGGTVNISNGGTLDVGGAAANAVDFSTKQFYISGAGVGGNGAIINSSATNSQNNAFQAITLTGDATIGGTSRFDLRDPTAPNLDLAGFTLTKTGSNQIDIVAGNITAGNIVVNQGTFGIQTSTKVSGTGTTITYNNGTTADFWNNGGDLTKATMIFNGTNTLLNESGASAIGSNITINGSTTFSVLNAGTSPSLTLNTGQLTINGSANFNLASGTSMTLAGSMGGTGTATLNGAGGLTPGTLTLGANQLFNGELDLASGTLSLAGYKLTVNTLRITGNSTIDFGNSLASILDTTDLFIAAGVTLTIANWADVTDYFYATNNPSLANPTALSQITFNSPYASNPTKWLSYTDGPDNNHQITPVPEPGTYGALLMAAALGLFVWQRRKAMVAQIAS